MINKNIGDSMIKIYNGDCLEIMSRFKDKSFDAIITDPPYGTTACKWDSVIPFEPMWKQLKRITKDRGAIVLFGSEPFSSALRISNIKMYKYDWIWKKNRHSNFLTAKYEPRRVTENICIFCPKKTLYYPQKIKLSSATIKRNNRNRNLRSDPEGGQFEGIKKPTNTKNQSLGLPINIIEIKLEQNNQYKKQVFHPTQKPVALMEYLIKTYTNEGEIVLDFTMGSGTTLVACKKTNRNGIGIEQDKKYCEIAEKRLKSIDSVQVDLF